MEKNRKMYWCIGEEGCYGRGKSKDFILGYLISQLEMTHKFGGVVGLNYLNETSNLQLRCDGGECLLTYECDDEDDDVFVKTLYDGSKPDNMVLILGYFYDLRTVTNNYNIVCIFSQNFIKIVIYKKDLCCEYFTI